VKKYTENVGREWFTVIRMIKERTPIAADRRAIAFYEANNPKAKINIYRIKT